MKRLGNVLLAAGMAAVVLASAGCSQDGQHPKGAASAGPSTPGATVSAGSAAAPACTVAGFVPGHLVVLSSARREVLYARGVSLPPGGSNDEGQSTPFVGKVRPGVRVLSPAGGTLTPEDVRSIGHTVDRGRVSLPAQRLTFARLHNPTPHNQAYVVFADASVYRGRWSEKFCGGTINDGSTVTTYRGTFVSVGGFRTRALPCSSVRTHGREMHELTPFCV